jgi:DNA ligase D-like protein (predicted 3'-phosphoesterase)
MRFSIQKHEAIDLHYVLRLEVGDQIRSWAVPRGPSPDPRVKRLAIPVEESCALDFEGIYPPGSTDKIIVWDTGEYTPFELDGEPMSVEESLTEGKLEFTLHGQKLQGGFQLLRIDDPDERWLLMKNSDEKATSRRNPVVSQPLSVVSGRDVSEVKE